MMNHAIKRTLLLALLAPVAVEALHKVLQRPAYDYQQLQANAPAPITPSAAPRTCGSPAQLNPPFVAAPGGYLYSNYAFQTNTYKSAYSQAATLAANQTSSPLSLDDASNNPQLTGANDIVLTIWDANEADGSKRFWVCVSNFKLTGNILSFDIVKSSSGKTVQNLLLDTSATVNGPDSPYLFKSARPLDITLGVGSAPDGNVTSFADNVLQKAVSFIYNSSYSGL